MRKLTSMLAFLLVVLMAGLGTVATTSATFAKKRIKVKNTTNFNIDEIYISHVDAKNWGHDILDPDEVLVPGEVIELDIDCDLWDVKLVAEDHSECIVHSVKVCSASQWDITADCHK